MTQNNIISPLRQRMALDGRFPLAYYTSVPQLYRLLDPANHRKSMRQLISLLHVLNCDVDLVVKERTAA